MSKFEIDQQPKTSSGFKIPEHYFDDFSSKMLQKLQDEDRTVIPINRKKSNWMYAAAAVLVVSLSIPFYNILKKPTLELDNTTLENYITDHSGISDADFVELLDEKDLEQISIDSGIEKDAIEDLLSTNTNLESYLIN
ncbi:MAG TPA: hypothetical protein PLS51_10890 [Flavobacterium sp.]|nr:hypothetical protein [Flavobacterium sp.]HPJ11129.1 hypothetical protein [Flavobacterium sp.]